MPDEEQGAKRMKRMDGVRAEIESSYRCAVGYCAEFAVVRDAVADIVRGENRFVDVSVSGQPARRSPVLKRDESATICFSFDKGDSSLSRKASLQSVDLREAGSCNGGSWFADSQKDESQGADCLILVSKGRSSAWTYVGIEADEDCYSEKEALDIRNRIKPVLDRKLHNECDKNWAWECDKRRRIDRMKNPGEWVDTIPLFAACLVVLVFAVIVCVVL